MKNNALPKPSRSQKGEWTTTQLGEIAELRGRIGWKGLTAKEYTKDGPRFLSVHSLNYGDYVDYRDAFHISQDRYDESPEIMLQKDDILICKDGAGIGKLGIVPAVLELTTINASLLLIRPGTPVLPKYLYYCLLSPYFQNIVQSRLEGTTTPHLYQRDIMQFPVYLAPMREQKQIVAVLDQAFAALDRARTHAEANLADAEALFVQVAYDNLKAIAKSGKLVQVGEVAEHCLGKMLDKQKNKGTFRPYLRNINIRWFEIDTSDVLEMRIEDRELERYEVRKGDLLICEGGYPGRASIYQSDDSTYFQKALHRVRFDDESLPKVLMYWLFVDDKLGKLSDYFSGTGISHFTGKALVSYPMPVSDPATNARAVTNIDQCLVKANSLMASYKRKLVDLTNLRQSLLQKAFSGQLT